jgi:hypothetical protein
MMLSRSILALVVGSTAPLPLILFFLRQFYDRQQTRASGHSGVAARFLNAMDGSNVGVIDLCQDLRLAAEAGHSLRVLGEGLR